MTLSLMLIVQRLLVNGQPEAYLLSLKAETTVWVSTTGVFTGDAGGAGDPRKLKENNKHQLTKEGISNIKDGCISNLDYCINTTIYMKRKNVNPCKTCITY